MWQVGGLSRNMSTPRGPVVARPVVMGCVTDGFAVRQHLWSHGPPVTHPMTTGRATTGATASLDGALRFIHSGARAYDELSPSPEDASTGGAESPSVQPLTPN